jgi:hypothetical protein
VSRRRPSAPRVIAAPAPIAMPVAEDIRQESPLERWGRSRMLSKPLLQAMAALLELAAQRECVPLTARLATKVDVSRTTDGTHAAAASRHRAADRLERLLDSCGGPCADLLRAFIEKPHDEHWRAMVERVTGATDPVEQRTRIKICAESLLSALTRAGFELEGD